MSINIGFISVNQRLACQVSLFCYPPHNREKQFSYKIKTPVNFDSSTFYYLICFFTATFAEHYRNKRTTAAPAQGETFISENQAFSADLSYDYGRL